MSLQHPTPPLLLSKRLTSFLHANQTPQLPTLLLTSTHGKLLAHASPHPVSLLRTHATVAASLLAIHTSSSTSIPSSLPGAKEREQLLPSSDVNSEEEEEGAGSDIGHGIGQKQQGGKDGDIKPVKPVTITVQLSHGTLVLRRLKCGLLFVCVGPAAAASSTAGGGAASIVSAAASTAVSVATTALGDQQSLGDQVSLAGSKNTLLSVGGAGGGLSENGEALAATSPSEVDSMISAAGQGLGGLDGGAAAQAAVAAMRRHVGELARWLDDKLGTLKVPEDGVGYE